MDPDDPGPLVSPREPNTPAQPAPPQPRSRQQQLQLLHRDQGARGPVTQQHAKTGRDLRLRAPQTKSRQLPAVKKGVAGRVGDVSNARGGKLASQSTAATTKWRLSPLLPVTERKSQEEGNPRSKKPAAVASQEPEKWEVAPDGGSGGRGARHFAVSNVGNNGRIYLR
jgi:hypothetical protein